MSIEFLSDGIWRQLTRDVRRAEKRCDAAVAYFGSGASRLLPLRRGARLVVDASDRAVRSGQTSPRDLRSLVRRGVRVFNAPNLHAKVFVVGRSVYVGSTNASTSSATGLVEAVLRTTDLASVRTARAFVRSLCLDELTPARLARLSRLYRPPRYGRRRAPRVEQASGVSATEFPPVYLAQLKRVRLSTEEEALRQRGLTAAGRLREHPSTFELDDFKWTGACPYKRGDKVIQVTTEHSGRRLITAPGTVIHVRQGRNRAGRVAFVYVERRAARRRESNAVAKIVHCRHKQLTRNGIVRNRSLAAALLNMWAA